MALFSTSSKQTATADNTPEQDDAYDAKLVSDIIDNFLLAPQTSDRPAGLIAALDQASKENYLGDPKVVRKL